MAWKSGANSPLGMPVPGNVDATELVKVGTIGTFFDETQGEGKFIYLPGVASTAAGDAVEYDMIPGTVTTIRHTNATAPGSGRQIAIATAAIIAATYGWYQIQGVAIVNVAAGMAAGLLFSTATAGVLDDGQDNGDQILNARCLTAVGTPAATKSYCQITYPFVQGQIV